MSEGFKQTSSTEDLQTANNHIKKKKMLNMMSH